MEAQDNIRIQMISLQFDDSVILTKRVNSLAPIFRLISNVVDVCRKDGCPMAVTIPFSSTLFRAFMRQLKTKIRHPELAIDGEFRSLAEFLLCEIDLQPQTNRKLSNAVFPATAEQLFYLIRHGYPFDSELTTRAAQTGNLKMLKILHALGIPWTSDACVVAAANGNLDCLRWAHENGCPWHEDVCTGAVILNWIECLRWAHENGCPWTDRICHAAAFAGSLDCLRYLHEHGAPWDTNTCSLSAHAGHLDCLIYLHEHGCPWDQNTCLRARQQGHLDCLHYAQSHGLS